MWGRILLAFLTVFVCVGCGGRQPYVRSGFMDNPPSRVAVLPFVITYAYDLAEGADIPDSHRLGRDLFRKTFYYLFATYGYRDVEQSEVDAKLTEVWGPIEEGAWQKASPQELGSALGADALIYGEVHRLMHFSTPLYTETSLKATLRMVDASSEEVLWRKRVKSAERGGILLQKGQVVDFIKDQARSFNAGVKFLRVADHAVRQAVNGLPNPTISEESEVASPWALAREEGKKARLAVLPLDVKREKWHEAAGQLRTYLTAGILEKGLFAVVENQHVDGLLHELGVNDDEPLPEDASWLKLGETLGADVLLRGSVTHWGRSYWIIQSWVKAGLALDLIDVKSGEVIWRKNMKKSRTAGLLKGPTGYKSFATSALKGLKRSHLERVANHLARAMAEELGASPAVLAYTNEKVSK